MPPHMAFVMSEISLPEVPKHCSDTYLLCQKRKKKQTAAEQKKTADKSLMSVLQ